MTSIQELFDAIRSDPWREDVGFNDDLANANEMLFNAASDGEAITVLRDWLARHQPCLFGRIGAKADLISFCILSEADLCGDPKRLQDKIQDSRTEWTREGYEGKKSAFVIVAISPALARAIPDPTVMAIASRLTSSYLLREIKAGEKYHDEICLEKPGTLRTTWRWYAGVNYFSSQGDRRWWQDHRIPGGIALSINSVGHMVKSGQLSEALRHADDLLGGPEESMNNERITSLAKALDVAMRTIAGASEAASGKATYLLPLPANATGDAPACPATLPKSLMDYDYMQYEGWYDTDVTLPAEYFRPDVERPLDVAPTRLDFTYLFHDDIENPDHITMGVGRRIRTGANQDEGHRIRRMVAESVAIRDQPLLCKALGRTVD